MKIEIAWAIIGGFSVAILFLIIAGACIQYKENRTDFWMGIGVLTVISLLLWAISVVS
jgi:O-antigen ligase